MQASSMDTAAQGGWTGPAVRPARMPELDYVKGALVLIMVLYHWLNYFVPLDSFGYRYLRFLTPSFIFITGFLVGRVYYPRRQDARVPRRLLVRGGKLLALLVALNAAKWALASATTWGDVVWALLLGNAQEGATVSFAVLAPIAYLLVAAAGLLPLLRRWPVTLHAVAAAVLAANLALAWLGQGVANLELVGIGLLGASLGSIQSQAIELFGRRPGVALAAYAGYLAGITMWDAVYALQIVGVFLSVAALAEAGRRGKGALQAGIVELGKYSLLGYIGQIAVLQGLRRVLDPAGGWVAPAGIALVAGLGLTILGVWVVDRLRQRMTLADRVYGAVFS